MGSQLPLRKGAQPPVFGPFLLCTNGWMDEHANWYGSRPRPRRHCIRRGPSCPRKAHSRPRPCPLWPRSPISTTAELLSSKSSATAETADRDVARAILFTDVGFLNCSFDDRRLFANSIYCIQCWLSLGGGLPFCVQIRTPSNTK